jgi:hypothetical protein
LGESHDPLALLQEAFGRFDQPVSDEFLANVHQMMVAAFDEARQKARAPLLKEIDELSDLVADLVCRELLLEQTPGLTITEREQLATLMEGVALDPDDWLGDFARKLQVMRAPHFPARKQQPTYKSFDEQYAGSELTEDMDNPGDAGDGKILRGTRPWTKLIARRCGWRQAG